MSAVLNGGLLPATHYALIEQITMDVRADALALERPGRAAPPGGPAGLALAAPAARTVESARPTVPRTRKRVVVRHTTGGRVVAVVELISPANKRQKRDFEAFVNKAVELLVSGVHLLLIDPFPPTRRDPVGLHPVIWGRVARRRKGAPRYAPPPGQPLAVAGYASGTRMVAAVEPFAVGEPVPNGPLYLTPKGHLTVPLESTYMAAWDKVPAFIREGVTAAPAESP